MHGRTAKRVSPHHVIALTLLLGVAMLASVLLAQSAQAYDNWVHGGASCTGCHTGDRNANCATCHTGFQRRTAAPQDCWTCHTPGQDTSGFRTDAACTTGCHLASGSTSTHPAHYGSTSAPCTTCHGLTVSAADPGTSPHHDAVNSITKTTATLQLAGLTSGTIKLGKTVTAKGTVKPIRAGTVLVTIQRKVSTGWVKVIAKARTMTTTGAYSYPYKTTRRGTFRVQAKTAAVVPYSSVKTVWKTFKVK